MKLNDWLKKYLTIWGIRIRFLGMLQNPTANPESIVQVANFFSENPIIDDTQR
jgi:hypothetical protein